MKDHIEYAHQFWDWFEVERWGDLTKYNSKLIWKDWSDDQIQEVYFGIFRIRIILPKCKESYVRKSVAGGL